MKPVLPMMFRDTTRRAYLAWALALIGALLLPATGIGEGAERELHDLRASLQEKPATGKIALVEIDAKSIRALGRWPWPREYYAELITRLSRAGADQIAFDIDFSSPSSPDQDAVLADALKRSDAAIVLATFKQASSSGRADLVESLPIQPLRENAFLGSVNVHPDKRGQLNTYSFGTVTGNKVRPSLAAMLAESSGDIGERFLIDQSIAPDTIPRYSFVDILNAEPSSLDLKGKKILVGATAIELGDQYPIGRFGVTPGVVIQTLAAETLIQNSNVAEAGFWIPLAVVATLTVLWLRSAWMRPGRLKLAAILLAVASFGTLLMAERFGLMTFAIVPTFAFLGLFLVAEKSLNTALALKISMFANKISNLPNETAMENDLEALPGAHIAIARLAEFGDLLVVTDQNSRMDMFKNLSERLKFLAEGDRIYHLDPDIVGWIVKDEYVGDVGSHFETAAALFRSPVITGTTKVKLRATFGVSCESIDKAKIASEQAERAGIRWAWHDNESASATGTKQSLLVDVDQAIENGDIWIVYQPKWHLAKKRLYGAEALVRWRHPQHGMISPDIFVPMLEQAERIDELTMHILQAALDDFSRWDKVAAGLTCSVNISANLLKDRAFIERAIAAVDAADIGNGQIIFEITETAAMADIDRSIVALTQLREVGIKVAIDDYGTGQSSLSYLQRLPIDELKIDQAFVRTMVADKGNRAIVQSTVALAHKLGLIVVGEGVEDGFCMNLLTELECDIGQGWHISRPIDREQFEAAWVRHPEKTTRFKSGTSDMAMTG